MNWEVSVRPRHAEDDLDGKHLAQLLRQKTGRDPGAIQSGRVYLVSGLEEAQVRQVVTHLLVDSTVEQATINKPATANQGTTLTILPKPGVMDPVAASVQFVVTQLNLPAAQVRTGKRFYFTSDGSDLAKHAFRLVANDAIEQGLIGPLPIDAWKAAGSQYDFRLITVPIRGLNDDQLKEVSKQGQLALSLDEMRTIQTHFQSIGREPTDVELETIAQTWSEHCSHKTFKSRIEYIGPEGKKRFDNLLKETIAAATQEIRNRLGKNDWCVSVFVDNAGVVRFTDDFHACIKVETHNRPSAIEPYGGASTGIGGVIRDVLGTGLGGRPIANTDVFCFAPLDFPDDKLPTGVLPPRRIMQGVVAGVRDYGNRMGIATVNGAIYFDERYLGNPLVFCGTIGLITVGKEQKGAQAGDLIVALGGRTGRDGIHGATFSSAELSQESEKVSGGAVQIGNAITEKMLLDVILQARDDNLYHAITDCGAGGFSSAVGEMGAELGAEVYLDRAPLKYSGLSYTEIWISEAQERMVLAVPPDKWPNLEKLCNGENVEAVVLGEFQATGRLRLYYDKTKVADLDMHFLHEGRPPIVRQATWSPPVVTPSASRVTEKHDFTKQLLNLLGTPTIASKEAVIRRYDHEVQGATVIKPMVGVTCDGPGDAAVIAPVRDSSQGLAIGCGLCPSYGDIDPYAMAACAVDEALRNVVAVGANPNQIAVLDNFCWGNTDRPEILGALVRAAEGCRDAALAFGTPFISGKDSLKNEFQADGIRIVIPHTLLITALGHVPDVRKCVTMDLKKPGQKLYLVGWTRNELGASQFALLNKDRSGNVPRVDLKLAPQILTKVYDAIRHRMVSACHDISEGGLAVALAEMAFAGGFGAVVHTNAVPVPSQEKVSLEALLFGESPTRFLLEVPFEWERSLEILFEGLPIGCIGQVSEQPRLTIFGSEHDSLLINATLAELKQAWQRPLANVV